jgi:hypothetical protein
MTMAAPPANPAPPQVLLAHHLRQLKLPTDRERRMVERRIRAARFPAVKSFDTFDFAAIPSLNKPVLELARCEYVVARENVIALRHRQDACPSTSHAPNGKSGPESGTELARRHLRSCRDLT